MEKKFEIGQLVRHKTGGRDMVIVNEDDETFMCEWWCPINHRFVEEWFIEEALNFKE